MRLGLQKYTKSKDSPMSKRLGQLSKLEKDTSPKRQSMGTIDVKQLEEIVDLKDASSSLEFLISTLASKFELKTSQVYI